jgi:hypothetical protein
VRGKLVLYLFILGQNATQVTTATVAVTVAGKPKTSPTSEMQLPVRIGRFAETLHELVQVKGILSSTAPRAGAGCSLFEKVRDVGRRIAFIKQLIQRDFKSSRSVAILYARNVAAQPRPLFDISWLEFSFPFANSRKRSAITKGFLFPILRSEGDGTTEYKSIRVLPNKTRLPFANPS